ncbi:MAG: 50S ribosomal protein L24e [Thermoplasmatota archaeon]
MVDKKDCSFCGRPIEPGTGKLFVKKDGTKYHFCSMKCQKNLLVLRRVPRHVKWTSHFEKGIVVAQAAAPDAGATNEVAATEAPAADAAPASKSKRAPKKE